MKRNEPVSRIMTKGVKSVQVGQRLSQARNLLAKNSIHHVPVLDGERLVGMLSSIDLMRVSFDAYGADERTVDATLDQQFKIRDLMQRDLVTLSPTNTIRDAANMLGGGEFHSLPVVDRANVLVGIVTSTDLINYLADAF